MPQWNDPNPQWIYNTTATSASTGFTMIPTFYTGTPFATDISFDPNPKPPARPKTDMDWLREQNDAICALAGLR